MTLTWTIDGWKTFFPLLFLAFTSSRYGTRSATCLCSTKVVTIFICCLFMKTSDTTVRIVAPFCPESCWQSGGWWCGGQKKVCIKLMEESKPNLNKIYYSLRNNVCVKRLGDKLNGLFSDPWTCIIMWSFLIPLIWYRYHSS